MTPETDNCATFAYAFEKELEIARRIAEQAGRLALENHARGFESETKPDDSPVTSADRANERLITKLLEEAFPDDGLLGEEGASREARSGRRWIIDPIDGTRSFMRGIPTWGVMLALGGGGQSGGGRVQSAGAGRTLFRRRRDWALIATASASTARRRKHRTRRCSA